MDDKKRKIVYKALAATFAILFFSMLFANLVYDWRKADVDADIIEIYNQGTDLKISINFYDAVIKDVNSCKKMESQLVGLSDFIFHLGKKINLMVADKENMADIKTIQKPYVYNNLELWLRLKKFNTVCPTLKKNYIMYFYPYDCKECTPIETRLNELKEVYGDKLWIFSIPYELEVNTTANLLEYYEVNYIPAIIVNEVPLLGAAESMFAEDYMFGLDVNKSK